MRYLLLSLKMQFRVPISVFFTLVFPIVMMSIMLLSYGNFSIGNGFHFIDKYFLVSTSIGLAPLAFISFSTWLGESIQNKTYKRLKYFDIEIGKVILADIFSYVIIALISVLTNIIVAAVFFKLRIPNVTYFISYIVQVIYAIMGLLLFGASIGFIFKNSKIILPLGMILLFTIYMFIGVFVQFSELPTLIQKASNFLPLKYITNDFFNIWSEEKMWIVDFLRLNSVYCIIFSVIDYVYYKKTFLRGEKG